MISKKLIRVEENVENKKMFEDTRKKECKGHETVLKSMRNGKLVVEGENITNNHDPLYKKMLLRDFRETKEREDLLKGGKKRLRTKSKKKLNS